MNSTTRTDLNVKTSSLTPQMMALARTKALAPYKEFLEGNPLAQVLCIKGRGDDVAEEGVCLPQERDALRKAFVALGYADEDFCAVRVWEPHAPNAGELRMIVETLDPLVTVALDGVASHALEAAFSMQVGGLGVSWLAENRRFVVVDDFAAALASEETKRRVWQQLKAARRERITP